MRARRRRHQAGRQWWHPRRRLASAEGCRDVPRPGGVELSKIEASPGIADDDHRAVRFQFGAHHCCGLPGMSGDVGERLRDRTRDGVPDFQGPARGVNVAIHLHRDVETSRRACWVSIDDSGSAASAASAFSVRRASGRQLCRRRRFRSPTRVATIRRRARGRAAPGRNAPLPAAGWRPPRRGLGATVRLRRRGGHGRRRPARPGCSAAAQTPTVAATPGRPGGGADSSPPGRGTERRRAKKRPPAGPQRRSQPVRSSERQRTQAGPDGEHMDQAAVIDWCRKDRSPARGWRRHQCDRSR